MHSGKHKTTHRTQTESLLLYLAGTRIVLRRWSRGRGGSEAADTINVSLVSALTTGVTGPAVGCCMSGLVARSTGHLHSTLTFRDAYILGGREGGTVGGLALVGIHLDVVHELGGEIAVSLDINILASVSREHSSCGGESWCGTGVRPQPSEGLAFIISHYQILFEDLGVSAHETFHDESGLVLLGQHLA